MLLLAVAVGWFRLFLQDIRSETLSMFSVGHVFYEVAKSWNNFSDFFILILGVFDPL